jgi:hypothetical protein
MGIFRFHVPEILLVFSRKKNDRGREVRFSLIPPLVSL